MFTSSTKVLVAQLGARKHYQEPALFYQWGILDSLYTDLYVGKIGLAKLLRKSNFYSSLPATIKKALDRYDANLDRAKIIHFPLFGYEYAQKLKKFSSGDVSSISVWAGSKFSNKIIRTGLGNANTIYGFNGASLELFKYAKSKNIRCILDQTLAERTYVYELLLSEEESWQGWSKSAFTISDADVQLAKRESEEQQLADKIICGSEFVKDTLIAKGVDTAKISVVSLGRLKEGQITNFIPKRYPQQRDDGLRILFAGSVNLRKGVPYLLQALRILKGQIPFTCKIAGSLEIKTERVTEYSDVCEFLGRVARSQMAELYRWADVFVLPSICEGSAMVTYEALNWGLPVITTYNSGSIIRNGIDGFIVPMRNAEIIAEKLLSIYRGEYSPCDLESTKQYLESASKQAEEVLNKLLI